MSLILDALRKSDMERSRHKAPDVAAGGGNAAPRSGQRWLLPVIALLAVNLAFLAFLLFRPTSPAPAQNGAAAVTTAAPALATAPATSAPPPAKADVRSLLGETIREAAAAREDAAQTSPAAPASNSLANAPAGVSPESDVERGTLPSFSELSASGELALAPLRLELHVYSDRPASRFAFINGQKVVEGDRLNGGGKVAEITRFGVILEHNGRRFALDRD